MSVAPKMSICAPGSRVRLRSSALPLMVGNRPLAGDEGMLAKEVGPGALPSLQLAALLQLVSAAPVCGAALT